MPQVGEGIATAFKKRKLEHNDEEDFGPPPKKAEPKKMCAVKNLAPGFAEATNDNATSSGHGN